jgi:hypothetical protein
MNNTFSLSDNVIARIVQILQEGLMTGNDVIAHMRMIRVETDDEGKLQLSADYVKQVNEGYEKLNAEMLEKMKASNE